MIGKRDQSRRYLGKATNLDNTFGPAWLAYGHSFAVENEHDQAMAAYFKASQLLKGFVLLFNVISHYFTFILYINYIVVFVYLDVICLFYILV